MIAAADPTANGPCKPDCSPSAKFSDYAEGPSFATAAADDRETPSPDPLGPLLLHFAELKEYAAIYCAARIDRWRLAARGLVVKVAFGLIAGVFGITAFVVAAALFVNGMATGIGILCGGRIWLGQLIVGGMVIPLVLGSFVIGTRALRIAEHRRVVDKYEARKRSEHATFGTDVSERAMD